MSWCVTQKERNARWDGWWSQSKLVLCRISLLVTLQKKKVKNELSYWRLLCPSFWGVAGHWSLFSLLQFVPHITGINSQSIREEIRHNNLPASGQSLNQFRYADPSFLLHKTLIHGGWRSNVMDNTHPCSLKSFGLSLYFHLGLDQMRRIWYLMSYRFASKYCARNPGNESSLLSMLAS